MRGREMGEDDLVGSDTPQILKNLDSLALVETKYMCCEPKRHTRDLGLC